MKPAQGLLSFILGLGLSPTACRENPTPSYQIFFVSIGSGWYVNPATTGIHGFSRIPGANQSAKLIADELARGGAQYGIELGSDDRRFVTLDDIHRAVEQVAGHMARNKPQRPLFLFYFAGHGISEGIAWNHFSIPGDFAYRGNAASLDIEALANNTLYAGSLVDDLTRLHVPFLVLLDTCYDGKEQRFESSVFSAAAVRSLENTAQVLKALNEFRDTGPVLFSTTPGNSVPTVANPIQPDSPVSIAPLSRRFALAAQPALDSRRPLSLNEFLARMLSPDLDRLTTPAVTHSPVPAEADSLFLVPTTTRHPYDSELGTGSQIVICCRSSARQVTADHRDSIPFTGKLVISGASGEYISSGRTLAFASPSYSVTITQQSGSVQVHFEKGPSEFDANFSTPDQTPFELKQYSSAERWNMADPGHAGLEISGDARGCGNIAGSFKVSSVRYRPDGRLSSFSATFVQVCDDSPIPANGSIEVETTKDTP
jgi:hypothetical protein